MSNKAVLVVDMLRDFLEHGGALYMPEARIIIPHIQQLLEKELADGTDVIFICDEHKPKDLEFKIFPPHCIKGTPGAEVIQELDYFLEEIGSPRVRAVAKRRYSGFFDTQLDDYLVNGYVLERGQVRPKNKLVICGVCTDICVMHTVADARNRDYEVEIPRDCVASFNQEAHEWALKHMEEVLGAKVI